MRWINRTWTVGRFVFDRARFLALLLRQLSRGRRPDREAVLDQMMRSDWDGRAHHDAMYWIATRPGSWSADEFFQSGEADAARILGRSGVGLGRGDAVLEVGCGVGRLLRAMARRGAEVWGVDISGEMIARAEENLRGENVRLRVHGAHQLAGLPRGHFRLVYSYVVLQHVPEAGMILSCLEQSAGLLREGGTLVMQMRNDHGQGRTYNTYTGASVAVEDVRRVLAAAGLCDIALDGLGTQYLWVRATRPAVALDARAAA